MVWLSSLYVSKTNNKLHKNTTVKYQIQESTFSASCLCAERGGVLLRSKRTAFGSVEERISWILLQQNQPNASVSSCIESEGMQSWLDEKATPDEMYASPATQ